MVVAVLANRFAPSSRGLHRKGRRGNSSNNNWNRNSGYYYNNNYDHYSLQINNTVTTNTTTAADSIIQQQQQQQYNNYNDNIQPSTGHRRKPFRATAFLTSVASDLDVITDWIFYNESLQNDKEYRKNWNASDNTKPYLIPPILLNILLVSCVIGTILWLILATDGRFITPILRKMGIDKLSMGLVLFMCVLVEDIPQVVLTFLIEDYYEDNDLSNWALWNVTASLYDTLIKLAEAYDERNDIVETGIWCRTSIDSAHTNTITTVVTLPKSTMALQQQQQQQLDNNSSNNLFKHHSNSTILYNCNRDTSKPSPPRRLSSMPAFSCGNNSILHIEQEQQQEQSTTTMISNTYNNNNNNRVSVRTNNSMMIVPPPTPLPNFHLLSASLDGTIRLWDSHNKTTIDDILMTVTKQEQETTCIRVFHSGHKGGVTCLCLLPSTYHNYNNYNNMGNRTIHHRPFRNGGLSHYSNRKNNNSSSNNNNNIIFFLSGGNDGIVKLWEIDKIDSPIRIFDHDSICNRNNSTSVTSITTIPTNNENMFLTSYQDGSVRLWDIWNDNNSPLIAIFHGHHTGVRAICCLDHELFVTASDDKTICLWNINNNNNKNNDNNSSQQQQQQQTSRTDHCTVPSIINASFSVSTDRTECTTEDDFVSCFTSTPVQSFAGSDEHEIKSHNQSSSTLSAVAAAAASSDDKIVYTITSSLRVFYGHSKAVTSVARCDDGGGNGSSFFVSGSMDKSCRLWSANDGTCLRVFSGHEGGVSVITIIDEGTMLTGSFDTTIKAWDISRGLCLRTYTGHTGAVTDISITDDDDDDDSSTFVTTSVDRSIKIWLLTAVTTNIQTTTQTIDQIFDMNDGICRGLDPE